MEYNEFIKSKQHSSIDFGIKATFLPEKMFDFQKYVAEYAIKKGRCAVFLDTGLGKTIIELTTAVNFIRHTNKPALIITPLAVAFQFIKEAEKFGIDDIMYSKDGKYHTKIVICNYERLEHFNTSDFDCVILDESSILKNFEGATRKHITNFLRKTKYRFLFTATPSPNDYIELGTSSEALGYMGYADMISKFFKKNNNAIDVKRAGDEMYLKPHAERDFWRWISSWSISMRKPSDLGFSDELHILPELHEFYTIVNNKKILAINGQMQMFNFPAQNFFEIKAEVRSTIHERCEMAVKKSKHHETSVYWVNLNDEAYLISQLDKNAIEIKGKMNIDEKEEILLSFSKGEIKKLITKTSITCFGLNWQHCNHTTYFPTYSYEQYYQAIRRFWRFGQKNNVIVDLILSDGQTRIMDSLMIKKNKSIQMFENLTAQTNLDFNIVKKEFNKQIILPTFLTKHHD
ncbi:MAG TPA: DEAD/DEAH box helicase [Flavobacterium sp.]|nr:DEAD/DEAH box helicase [Flavobacterium sp.]